MLRKVVANSSYRAVAREAKTAGAPASENWIRALCLGEYECDPGINRVYALLRWLEKGPTVTPGKRRAA